jgi:pimeloyl-ACP methyl ester carboxylesterase
VGNWFVTSAGSSAHLVFLRNHTRMTEMEIELSAGTIAYADTGGDGPAIVLLGGLLMDGSLYEDVIARLAPEHRCIAPTLPLGAHRHPMHEDADLSPRGLAALVAEFLERLELDDVTLVGSDTGGAVVQLLAADAGRIPRVGRIVLVSCDAFDNFPPGLTGRTIVLAGRLPPALFGLFAQQMRLRAVRRLPIAFGRLTRRGDAVTARWIRPVLSQSGIRRDAVRVLRGVAADRDLLVHVARRLPAFDRPALVVWAADDRVMPPAHGRRLAELLPQGRLVEIDDSDTLIALDQPERLAAALAAFVAAVGEIGALAPLSGGKAPTSAHGGG